MYSKDFYKDLNGEQIKARVEEEGFSPTLFSNGPGDIYRQHQHPETKLLAFLEGSMKVKIGEKEYECKAGDKVIIPGNKPHSAIVGPNGCKFYWSEKLI